MRADPINPPRPLFDSRSGDVDVDAMVDRFMAEDFVEHEAIPGMGNTRETPGGGNRVEWSVIDILQFRGDACIAHWGVMDMASAMAQMGTPGH